MFSIARSGPSISRTLLLSEEGPLYIEWRLQDSVLKGPHSMTCEVLLETTMSIVPDADSCGLSMASDPPPLSGAQISGALQIKRRLVLKLQFACIIAPRPPDMQV